MEAVFVFRRALSRWLFRGVSGCRVTVQAVRMDIEAAAFCWTLGWTSIMAHFVGVVAGYKRQRCFNDHILVVQSLSSYSIHITHYTSLALGTVLLSLIV